MTEVEERTQKALVLHLLGEMCRFALNHVPKIFWRRRRFLAQLELEVLDYCVAEFGATEKFHEVMRRVFPTYPKNMHNILVTDLVDMAVSQSKGFGWKKRYEERLTELEKKLGIYPTEK